MNGIAIGSLIVAVFALVWTIYRDIATRRDIRQEREDRRDQLAREEGRRDEELRLLRLRVERELDASRSSAQADLVAKSTGYSGSSQGTSYPITLRNVGRAVARDITVWLALAGDEGSEPSGSPPLTPAHEVGVLAANDPQAVFDLLQGGAHPGGGVPRDGLIVASWRDDAGDHTEAIGSLTVFL